MFDDDALVYYIVKVIEHHEDIHQVPDKNYIASDIIDLIQKIMIIMICLKNRKYHETSY